jgi:TrmH family RNA methyltransferase
MTARPETVTSRANPLYGRLRALKERGTERDLCLLEGPKLVLEALGAGVEIVEAVASPDAARGESAAAAVQALQARGITLRLMRDALVASLSELETSQGLVALARRPSFDEEALFRGTPLVVVAASIQNPGNLGGLLRSAEAAGATGAYLADGCADPFSWKALRGSMGSTFRLPHIRGLALEAILDRLALHAVPLVATATAGGERYDAVDLTGPVALAFGSEGAGLPPDVLQRAARQVSIPLASPVESLNVGVAAGILLFEAARQRRSRPGSR